MSYQSNCRGRTGCKLGSICVSGLLLQSQRRFDPTAKAGWMSGGWPVVELTSVEQRLCRRSLPSFQENHRGRAAEAGSQTIRLVFDQPQGPKQILVVFEEKETARTQEFVLRWSADGGTRFEKLSASGETSALRRPFARSRNIQLSSQASVLQIDDRPERKRRKRSRRAQESAPVLRSDPCFSRT
jgi:hypothetical protein